MKITKHELITIAVEEDDPAYCSSWIDDDLACEWLQTLAPGSYYCSYFKETIIVGERLGVCVDRFGNGGE